MAWDEDKKLLYLADEKGWIHVAPVYMGSSMTNCKHLLYNKANPTAPGGDIKIKSIEIHKSGKDSSG
jgi:hypothetical protein